MAFFERTTGCGQVTEIHIDSTISLAGWVDRRRDHGDLIFVDLRDRSGVMQVVFSKDVALDALTAAHALRSEFVISVTGVVVRRTPTTINAAMPTGMLELQVHSLTILNRAKTLPFSLEEAEKVEEELRLKYRYLDLRRPAMLHRVATRHKLIFAIREFLVKEGFYEIETPLLTKNTAEGAREFLVPSRNHKGSFYALPQSPQLYKQILMAAGIEKYFQIARCFRDEDLRADRQPEFTQLDMEMSFITEDNIQDIIERLCKYIFKHILNKDIQLPLPRKRYDEVMALYGSDKPDLRFDLPIYNMKSVFLDSQVSFLRKILDDGGSIGALCVTDKVFSRSELEYWVSTAIKNGAKGMVWIRFTQDGQPEAPIARLLPADFFERVKTAIPTITVNDTLFVIAGPHKEAWAQLGKLRSQLGHELELINPEATSLFWVVDFPLLEFDEQEKRWSSVHHPFTSPQPGWESLEPAKMKARAYDIVLNGVELGGGSIRIHSPEIQRKIFDFLGLKKEEMEQHFGFLLEAQQLGFPPHGGIALGLDRFVMLLLDCATIRDVMVFPKTQSGADPMMEAPTPVTNQKLADYNLKLIAPLKPQP